MRGARVGLQQHQRRAGQKDDREQRNGDPLDRVEPGREQVAPEAEGSAAQRHLDEAGLRTQVVSTPWNSAPSPLPSRIAATACQKESPNTSTAMAPVQRG